MRLSLRAAATTLGALVLTLAAAPAWAGNGGTTTPTGYAAHVSVHLSGDYSGSAVSSVPGPPPVCWWENLDTTMLASDKVDTSDPTAVYNYYKKYVVPYTQGSDSGLGRLATPSDAYFKQIAQEVAAGAKMTFYVLRIRDGYMDPNPANDAQQAAVVAKACGTTTTASPYGPVLMSWQAFPTGQEPPPGVDPYALAQYAYSVMDLVHPTLSWNPTLATQNDATLVNLPTWLWTTDPAAMEQRQVTATAGAISVTVTADPHGMTVTSPVGGTQCSTSQAHQAYSPGVDPAKACVLTFPEGSINYASGFPVQASTGWQAAWTSNVGPGGDLDPKTVTGNTNIPVIEVQSLVNQVS